MMSTRMPVREVQASSQHLKATKDNTAYLQKQFLRERKPSSGYQVNITEKLADERDQARLGVQVLRDVAGQKKNSTRWRDASRKF